MQEDTYQEGEKNESQISFILSASETEIEIDGYDRPENRVMLDISEKEKQRAGKKERYKANKSSDLIVGKASGNKEVEIY